MKKWLGIELTAIVFLMLLLTIPCVALCDTDSLENLLQKKLGPRQRLDILINIAKAKHHEGDRHCLIYAEDALMLADSIKDVERIAEANHISGLSWKLCGDNSTAILKLYHAAENYKVQNMQQKYSIVLADIGETYRANGNHSISIEYLRSALTIQKELADSQNIAITYNRLAASSYEVLISQPSYQKFIKGSNQSYNEIKRILETDINLKQHLDSTLNFLYNSERIARKLILNETIISNNTILGATYAAIYEFNKADSILNFALEMILGNKVEKEIPLIYYNFARLRMYEKRYEEAINFSLQAFDLAQKNETKIYRLLSSYLLGELYQKVENYPEAIKYMNTAHEEISYYYKNDLGLRINALQYQNELDKKESNLVLQRTKTKYLIHFVMYISIIFILFFASILLKNKKLKKLNLQLERKSHTIALQNEELKILNAEKDKFFSIIAHDLKGPLGTFVSINDLILEEIEKKRIEKVKLLSGNLQIVSYHIYGLLENLLDWSRIQRNSIQFNPKPVRLNRLIEESVQLVSDGAKRKGINLTINTIENLEIVTDPNMVQTILRNLASNAIKYTSEGGTVTVSAKLKDDKALICVEDTGIGMSPEIIDGLFKLNGSSNRLGTDQEPSTGLGLILCKEFVEKMGGEINIESETGKGSKFSVTLPL